METMKKITLKTPCTEDFEGFEPTRSGGFCQSCSKEVIDFTQMGRDEMMQRLEHGKDALCGRFKIGQLFDPLKRRHGLRLAGFSLLGVLATQNLQAQEVTTSIDTDKAVVTATVGESIVSGTVFDDQGIPMVGANVVLKDSELWTTTDFNGKFEFPKPLKVGDTLLFSFLGYDTKSYEVTKETGQKVVITVQFDQADILLMGEVMVEGLYSSTPDPIKKHPQNRR
ncbi:carboxypeptidase-like regulatory domain-containing protein [Flagellimonas sp. DF-77]|uniref:carboxypeptidase-like regulatory domain-containing protein n=1 Tax=Flagellimonas algarum TaxID=3230298 RepID=UPI0033955CCD